MTTNLDCKTFSRLISDRQDRELEASDLARLHTHFVVCDACRTIEEQLAFLRRAMKAIDTDRSPP